MPNECQEIDGGEKTSITGSEEAEKVGSRVKRGMKKRAQAYEERKYAYASSSAEPEFKVELCHTPQMRTWVNYLVIGAFGTCKDRKSTVLTKIEHSNKHKGNASCFHYLSIWGEIRREIWMRQTACENSELANLRTRASVSWVQADLVNEVLGMHFQ